MTSAFQQAAQQAQQAAQNSGAPQGSSLTEDDGNGGSSLFGGEKLSSLFNIFVPGSEWRTGIITKPPRDVQSRDDQGKPKFWDDEAKKVTDINTGKPLFDSLIVLQTEYRYSPQEIEHLKLDPLDIEDDKGIRGVWASGDLKKAIMRAIKQARVRTESEMVGMRFKARRGQKVPIPGTTREKWSGAEVILERV